MSIALRIEKGKKEVTKIDNENKNKSLFLPLGYEIYLLVKYI